MKNPRAWPYSDSVASPARLELSRPRSPPEAQASASCHVKHCQIVEGTDATNVANVPRTRPRRRRVFVLDNLSWERRLRR
jgi:hypothetical protein